MYVPEKLKLNKFKEVAIPKKSEYFKRFGEINGIGNYTGEDGTAPHMERKTDAMAGFAEDLEAYDKMKQAEASKEADQK